MERTTPASSSAKLCVSVPTAWHELTEPQLLYILRLLASGIQPDSVEIYAFLRFAELGVVRTEGDTLIVRKGCRLFPLSRQDLIHGAMALDFIHEPPPIPQRPARWRGVPAVDAELHGVPFGEYLQIENYMQRYLQQPDNSLLYPMARLLYPGLRPAYQPKVFGYLIIHWLTGLKMLFARLYPDLFRPSPAEDGLPDLREIMLAQIRALTAGDVTKEHGVLNVDTWTALAELNAKAREAKELERIYKK